MDRGLVEHLAEPAMNRCLYGFMHLWNPTNIWQMEFVLIWICSKGSENRFVVVQHFWCRKICKIVCRVPGKRVKSKFLYQDADVILLADKYIVVRSFVCRNYDKVLMKTGKFSDNLRVTENELVSGVDRGSAFKSTNSTFQNIGYRLNPLGKSVDCDILFLGPSSGILPARVHDSGAMKMRQVPCISSPCAKHLSVFGYGRNWDHLSLYGHMERKEIQNHSRNKVWDSGKDHQSISKHVHLMYYYPINEWGGHSF